MLNCWIVLAWLQCFMLRDMNLCYLPLRLNIIPWFMIFFPIFAWWRKKWFILRFPYFQLFLRRICCLPHVCCPNTKVCPYTTHQAFMDLPSLQYEEQLKIILGDNFVTSSVNRWYLNSSFLLYYCLSCFINMSFIEKLVIIESLFKILLWCFFSFVKFFVIFLLWSSNIWVNVPLMIPCICPFLLCWLNFLNIFVLCLTQMNWNN